MYSRWQVAKNFLKFVFLLMIGITFSMAADQPTNILERIETAYQSGQLSDTAALKNKVFAIIAPDRLAPALEIKAGEFIKCGTPVFEELARNWDQLSAAVQQEIQTVISQKKQSLKSTYISPSGKFNIHYTTSGDDAVPATDNNSNDIPDYVETFGEIFDQVWQAEVVDLGYIAPRLGSNNMQEVYIENLTGVYGYVQGTDNLHVDNDYEGFATPQLGCMQVTAAHEFHHEIQLTYHNGPSLWYMEVTSVYMEDYVYDDVDDYVYYLYEWYSHPWYSMTQTDIHMYAAGIWNFYLAEKFDMNIIREVWEDPNWNKMTGLINVLADHQTSLASEFSIFETWNYFTGYRADWQHDTFSEASEWPSVTMQKTHYFDNNSAGFYDQSVTASKYPEKLACNYIKCVNSGSDGILLVQIYGDPNYNWRGFAVADSSTHLTTDYELDFSNGYDGLAVIPSWGDLNEVVIVPSNVTMSQEIPNNGAAYLYSVEVVDAVVFVADFNLIEIQGNGNDALEADERGGLTVSVSNYGNDMQNVTLELSSESDIISLLDSTVTVGDFTANTTIQNSADPFTFQMAHLVTPQTVAVNLHILEDGSEVATETLNFNVGFSPVIFIDDDSGSSDNDGIKAALDSLELVYTYKDVSSSGYDNLYLMERETVIWSTGSQTTGLTATAKDSIGKLIDADVNLVLTGANIGSQLISEDWTPVQLNGTTTGGWMKGVDNDLLGQTNVNWLWATAPATGNELITPLDPRAAVSFAFLSSEAGGILRYRNKGRCVIVNSSFAALSQMNTSFMTPGELLALIFNYFDQPNALPSVFNLNSPSADTTIVIRDINQELDFDWEPATDTDEISYTFILNNNADYQKEYLYQTSGLGNSAYTLVMSELLDSLEAHQGHLTAYWGVYASDGKEVRLANDIHAITLLDSIPNLAPAPIQLLSPVDSIVVLKSPDDSVLFNWQASSDPEGQPLSYEWNITADSTMMAPFLNSLTTADTSLILRADTILSWFSENNDSLQVWWQTKVSDGENTISSDSAGLNIVKAINDPPSLFTLISPLPDSTFILNNLADSLVFRWEPSEDPEGNQITYQFQMAGLLSTDTTYYLDTTVTDTHMTLTGDQIHAIIDQQGTLMNEVGWIIIASDGGNKVQVGSFAQNRLYLLNNINYAPEPFSLIAPRPGDTLYLDPTDDMHFDFRWQAAPDPNNDSLTYQLLFYKQLHNSTDTLHLGAFFTPDTVLRFVPEELLDLMDTAAFLQAGWEVLASDQEYTAESIEQNSLYLVDPTQVRIAEQARKIPTTYHLYPNYPNPFNPTTTIRFDIPRENRVVLDIYNLQGKRLVQLTNDMYAPGSYALVWKGRDRHGRSLPSGIYIYRLRAGSYMANKKMLLVK